jgi:hypothetical protein
MSIISTAKIYIFQVFLLLLLVNHSSFSQDSVATTSNRWGVGIKLNNGITIKKYYKNKAVELIVSRPSAYKFNRFYYDSYHGNFKNNGYVYNGFDNISRPWALQLRYLIHKDVVGLSRLTWYYGAGAQIRMSNYYYNYYYHDGINTYYGSEKVRSFGVGADLVAGLEYTFKKAPISIFYDMNLYAEAFQHPLYFKLQGGLGGRYLF